MTGSDSHDDRPFIKDLLEEHSEAIASVKEILLADEIGNKIYSKGDNHKRYDEIWTLRYILSHKGNVKSAAKAALKTIKFRDEKKMNELGDIRHMLRNLGTGSDTDDSGLPHLNLFNTFCGENAAFCTLPDPDRGIVLYCDLGQIDQDAIANNMDEEMMTEYNLHANEAVFQVLDHVTRKTGRLTKQLKVIDMKNVSFLSMNRAYIKRDGAVNKSLEDYYPQILGSMLVANAPSWLNALWAAMRPFFPKRTVEKVDFLPSLSKLKSNKSYLKPILRYVSEENLPERYGGQNKEWPLPCAGELFGPQSSQ